MTAQGDAVNGCNCVRDTLNAKGLWRVARPAVVSKKRWSTGIFGNAPVDAHSSMP